MSDLAGFVLACVAKDEAAAAQFAAARADSEPVPAGCWDDVRVLAECEAKRRLVDAVQYVAALPEHMSMPDEESAMRLEKALLATAAIYADDPDYRQEWAEWNRDEQPYELGGFTIRGGLPARSRPAEVEVQGDHVRVRFPTGREDTIPDWQFRDWFVLKP